MVELATLIERRRPHRADAARNFDALIAAAHVAFTEYGVDASLEEIARGAGVGIGTLYRNFPTRDDLVEAVYAAEVLALCTYADTVAEWEPWPALEAWLRRLVPYFGTKAVLRASLVNATETLTCCRDTMFDAGEPLLARAQEAGEVRPDATVTDIIRMMFGIAGVKFDSDEQRDRVFGFALDGLRVHRS